MNKIMGYNMGIVDEWENVFANNDFMQALEQVNAGKLQALYISDKMKENIDLLRESGYFDS